MERACRIGFLVDGLLSRYQVRLFDSIRRAARRRGAIVVGFPGSYIGGDSAERIPFDGSFVYELAGPSSVDGIIVASNLILNGAGAARVRALVERDEVPVVSIGPLPGATTVDVDNHVGLKQVIQHLIVDHGHQRLAFIRGPLTNPDSLDRERVFRETLAALKVEVQNELVVTGNFLESSGAAAVRTLLGERHIAISDLDGIIAANDQMATGAMQELHARGLRIPEDLVVVGFDDDDHARSAHPPLTTVAQPLERIGETAVDLLLHKIAGRATQEKTVLETLPVLRRSCGCNGGVTARSDARSASGDGPLTISRLRDVVVRRLEWLGADMQAGAAIDHARDYLMAESDELAQSSLRHVERVIFELAGCGIDPLQWQDILMPSIHEVLGQRVSGDGVRQGAWQRGQNLSCLFSELSTAVLLQEQLRTVELANSLRVVGSAVVCARNFRALGRVLDAGLPGLDVRYCCVCVFVDDDRSRARVASLYNPTTPRPHNQIHSAEQLWRAIPPTLPPGVSSSSIGPQSFKAASVLAPNAADPSGGDYLVFPLMFGEEALGYVVLDVPKDAQRSWLLEGLSGHLSSAIYEISRTEQLRLARELAEAANSAKTAFVAMMSHEVRTPLNAIMGNLDLCLRTELAKEQRTQLLRAQTSSRALRCIVDDILDYSRVEAHRIDLESISFAFEEALEQVVSTCAPEACRKNLEFVLDIDPDIPQRLVGDSLRLTQVLLNLVNNAIKFSTHGFVAIRATRVNLDTPDLIQLHFAGEDTGIGMSQEQLSRIFQPFTQADSSITRRYGGTGLGLTICQRLVELMGGEILVRSEIGSGSTFEFSIPLHADNDAFYVPSGEPANIVLAIDNPAQLDALTRLFQRLRHVVQAASTGADALSLVARLPSLEFPQRYFVFADHQLADMTGQELLARLHLSPNFNDLTLILLVPYDNNTLLAGNWQSPAGESILAKPPLQGSIERILRGTRTSRPVSLTDRSELGIGIGTLAGQRVLVVQDSDLSRELAYDLLASNGAEVRTAVDGAEAIQLACSEQFDLVLMDLHLPVVDGCTATRTIREQHSPSNLPIVALSASAAPEDRIRCLEAGMNDFLRAPIGAAELVETVSRWLSVGAAGAVHVSTTPPTSTAMRINAATAPVLDVAKALGRLGGNRTLYSQLLRRFVQSYVAHADELSSLLDAQDCAKSANLVHTLVSAAGNVGATRLQHAAQSIELALRQAHQGHVLALRTRFEGEWQASVQAATNALERHLEGSRPPPNSSSAALVHEHVAQLRRLIVDHDTAAIELVELIEAAYVADPHTQQSLQRLAQSLSSYDFEAAQLHLDSLSTSLAGKMPPLPEGVS